MQVPGDGGQYFLGILTDSDLTDGSFSPGSDNDFVAAGYWLHVPDSGSTLDVSFGAFSDGGNPFPYTGSEAAAITNSSAVYSGVAVGAYCECADSAMESGNIDLFEANVTLTADFSSNMISGTVTDFQVDGNPHERTINLQSASISTASGNGGFFTGDTLLSGADDQGDGEWGGVFHGAVSGVTAPGSAAGTFGVSNDTLSYLGAFGATLE